MNLKYLFKRENKLTAILTIVYFLVGLMFCVLPSFMLSAFETLICILLLVYGVAVLFANCVSPVVSKNRKLILSAVVSVVLGSFLLFVRSFFVLVLGLVIAGFAIFKFVVLKKTKISKNMNWYIWLTLAILEIIFCIIIIMFFALNKFLNISVILAGVFLILESMANLIMLILNKKYYELENNENVLDSIDEKSVEE